MKNLTTKMVSLILTLAMIFSLAVPTFAVENYRQMGNFTAANTPKDIEIAREAYAALTPAAKIIFDSSLTYDSDMLEFHTTYVDKNFTPPVSKPKTKSAADMADPMQILMTELSGLGLPSAVLYALKAMGAGMVAAIADGPLPVGDILLAAATVSAAAVIAVNWDTVSPKFNQITRAFQNAFSETATNIEKAFADIKAKAIKIYYTDSKLTDEALKQLDEDINKQRHIKDPKHDWDKIIKGTVTWESIRNVMENVMKNGTESRYKGVYQRVLGVSGETVTVTFNKISDTLWAISNAWVNK